MQLCLFYIDFHFEVFYYDLQKCITLKKNKNKNFEVSDDDLNCKY